METGYCVKCKKSRTMNGAKKTKLKTGKNAMKGTCSVCGTKMFRFMAN